MHLDIFRVELPRLINRKVLLDSKLHELGTPGHSAHADSSAPARLLALVVSVGFWLTVGLPAGLPCKERKS
jgi:hypothetical protein